MLDLATLATGWVIHNPATRENELGPSLDSALNSAAGSTGELVVWAVALGLLLVSAFAIKRHSRSATTPPRRPDTKAAEAAAYAAGHKHGTEEAAAAKASPTCFFVGAASDSLGFDRDDPGGADHVDPDDAVGHWSDATACSEVGVALDPLHPGPDWDAAGDETFSVLDVQTGVPLEPRNAHAYSHPSGGGGRG